MPRWEARLEAARDWGKMAATFVDLNAKLGGDNYKGLRVVALEGSRARAAEAYPELATNDQQMRAYRELPDDALFSEQWVSVALPANGISGVQE